MQRKRIQATLAFAWNPLLLFEACVNTHNDTTILFLLLLAIWSLTLRSRNAILSSVVCAAVLALTACLKITLVLLFPGLLLFLFLQRSHRFTRIALVLLTYGLTIVLLYAPFWQGGANLDFLHVNPTTIHTANSPYDFVVHLQASLQKTFIPPTAKITGTPTEHFMHMISMISYIICYALLSLWYLIMAKKGNAFLHLLRWMALVWLLYCLVGSPWYWPWYIITFFGLYALIEAVPVQSRHAFHSYTRHACMSATRFLTVSTLSLYCLSTVAVTRSFIPVPGLYHFSWSWLSDLWLWALPLLVLLAYALAAPFVMHDRFHITLYHGDD